MKSIAAGGAGVFVDALLDRGFTESRTDELLGYAIDCPVDVQVFDEHGTLLLTVRDGNECNQKEGPIYCYAVFNQIDKDYEKYIYYPKDAGYTVKCVGRSPGTVDCSVFSIQDHGVLDTKEFQNVAVIKDTTISIFADEEKYIVSDPGSTSQKEYKLEQAMYRPLTSSGSTNLDEETSNVPGGNVSDVSWEVLPGGTNVSGRDRPGESDGHKPFVPGGQIPVAPDEQKPGVSVKPDSSGVAVECTITVEHGKASMDRAVYGSIVSISADDIPDGYVFHKWEAEGGEVLAEWDAKTFIVVKASYVKVKAVFAGYGMIPYESCYHNKTELRGKVEPSCTMDGYSGAKYCFGCGKIIDQVL